MSKIGIIVGAVPLENEKDILCKLISDNKSNLHIVAADGGMDSLISLNITPDEWVGDMDSTSLKDCPREVKITKVSSIKDETDMELAMMKCIEEDCQTVYIFGGVKGTRIEHTFANVTLMYKYALKGIDVIMICNESTLRVVVKGKISLGKRDNGYVSIFSLCDESKGVDIDGLFYKYKGNLTNSNALGVSNEYNGEEAFVSVEDGALLIVTEN